jgi:hypothetical protein
LAGNRLGMEPRLRKKSPPTQKHDGNPILRDFVSFCSKNLSFLL